MENKFLKIESENQWQDLLEKALFKTFFHRSEWEKFLEKEFKWLKFEHYNYQNSVLLSLARVKILGKEKLISHPFCEYGGPLPLVEKIDGRSFKEDLFSEFKDPFEINLHPRTLNYFENLELKEADSWRDTYWIENFSKLKIEELFSSFRYDIRHSIKRAEKQGFDFEECQSKDDLQKFYELYIKTVQRHKNIPLSFSFFEFFWQSAKIFFLKSGKKIVTGSVFLFYKPFIHYFITASDYSFRGQAVNHLLLFNVIKKYLGQDYDFFDLGATRKSSSLEIFKRGWRGKELPIFELSNRPDKLKLRHSKLRNVLGFLPLPLIKKVSPHLLKYKL